MKGVFFVVAACFMWALDSLIRYPLLGGGIAASSIVFYEHLILSAIFIFPFFKTFPKVWHGPVSQVFYFFIIGGVGSAMATLCFTEAFTLLNPSIVVLLQKLQPVWAIFLARLVLKESVGKKFLIWSAICLLGALLISFEDIFIAGEEFELGVKTFKGYGFALLAVLGWGSATVFGKKLSMSYNEKEIMGGRFLMGFLCLLPYIMASEETLLLSPTAYIKIIVLVLLSGLLGMYLYYKGLKLLSARTCALSEMSFPFCAVIANWLILGATLTPMELIGGALVVGGATFIQLKRY